MSLSNHDSRARLVKVGPDRAGQRVDNFLSAHLKGVPKAAVYRMIRTGQVRINGGRCKAATRLEEGDEVRVPPARIKERGDFTVPERAVKQINGAILFENRDLMVVDKPSGMAVHSGSGLPWGLIDVLRQTRLGEYFELAHRLDRSTSGCLVLARSGAALKSLAGQFREGLVDKRYLCLLDGRLPQAVVEVDAPLERLEGSSQKTMAVGAEGKPSRTRFHLLHQFADCCYAEAELVTGRTHQIRAHATHLGMPLAGDHRYASRESLRKWKQRGLKRLFLHAHHLGLTTLSGERLEIDAPLPPQLKAILGTLEK